MINLISKQYNGHIFHFREEGYFNMSKAAEVWGKNVNEFLRLPTTREYIEALSARFADKEIIKVQRGNGNLPTVGTWGHPKLAVWFAQWLDVKFSVFCEMAIDDLLKGNVKMTEVVDLELVQKLKVSLRQMGREFPRTLPEARRLLDELAEEKKRLAAELAEKLRELKLDNRIH